jgi:hypothetical protein
MSPITGNDYVGMDSAEADYTTTVTYTTATKKELLIKIKHFKKVLASSKWYQFGKKKNAKRQIKSNEWLLSNGFYRPEKVGE